jgi:putative NADH-flavin reductase
VRELEDLMREVEQLFVLPVLFLDGLPLLVGDRLTLRVSLVLADHHECREKKSPRARRSSSTGRTGNSRRRTRSSSRPGQVDVDEPHRPRERGDAVGDAGLAVLGTTGSVGRELVTQALAAGHEVTALVREPQGSELDERVAVVAGDATSAEAVRRAVAGSDAVVSALGHAKGAPDDVLTRATSNVVTAMRSIGLDRLVVLSSPAVVDTADRPNLFYRAARVLLRAVMPAIVRDHRTQARLIEESGLAWTIIRGPLIFTDGPRTATMRAPIGRDSRPAISRADLADFMLKASTAGAFIRMKPLVSA